MNKTHAGALLLLMAVTLTACDDGETKETNDLEPRQLNIEEKELEG